MADAAVEQRFTGLEPVATTDWWSAVRQYGFATALASALLGYLAFYVVEPARKNQQSFMDSVIDVNKENAKTMAKQTEIQQQQANAMSQIVPLLQQIRDDQRRGVWREP